MSFLFQGKRTVTVKPQAPAANAGSAFDEYRALKRNGLSFEAKNNIERRYPDAAPVHFTETAAADCPPVEQHTAIAEAFSATEPFSAAEPADTALHAAPAPTWPEEAMPTLDEETAPPLPETPMPTALEDFTDESTAAETPIPAAEPAPDEIPVPPVSVRARVAMLEDRGGAAPIPTPTLRSAFMDSMRFNRYRSDLYMSTAGRQNVSGTGFAGRTSFPEGATQAGSAQGPWPLRPPEGSFYTPACPIEDAVAAWYAPEQGAEIKAAWRGVAPENGRAVRVFSEYLVRLGNAELNGGVLGDVTSFREFVQAWLTQVSRSPELLEQTLETAFDATTSCDDRVLLTFNRLQSPRVLDDVKNAAYDRGLPDLVTAGRRQFRLERLERQASIAVETRLKEDMASPEIRAKIERAGERADIVREEIRETLRMGSEELETHLLMQIGNAKTLDLDLPIKDMIFRQSARLSLKQQAAAAERVKAQENTGFTEWFVQWTPWQTMLQRLNAAEYENIGDRKYAILEQVMKTLEADVDADIARMQASGELGPLESMTAAETVELRNGLGKARTDGIELEALLSITKEFLDGQGFGETLDPRWALDA